MLKHFVVLIEVLLDINKDMWFTPHLLVLSIFAVMILIAIVTVTSLCPSVLLSWPWQRVPVVQQECDWTKGWLAAWKRFCTRPNFWPVVQGASSVVTEACYILDGDLFHYCAENILSCCLFGRFIILTNSIHFSKPLSYQAITANSTWWLVSVLSLKHIENTAAVSNHLWAAYWYSSSWVPSCPWWFSCWKAFLLCTEELSFFFWEIFKESIGTCQPGGLKIVTIRS